MRSPENVWQCVMGYLAPVSDPQMLTTFRGELWDTMSALINEQASKIPKHSDTTPKWRGHYIVVRE